jgi:hypothetical protein
VALGGTWCNDATAATPTTGEATSSARRFMADARIAREPSGFVADARIARQTSGFVADARIARQTSRSTAPAAMPIMPAAVTAVVPAMLTETAVVDVPRGASEDGNWSDPDIVAEDGIVFAIASIDDDRTWIDDDWTWIDDDRTVVHGRGRVVGGSDGTAAQRGEKQNGAQRQQVTYSHASNPGAFLASRLLQRVKETSW